jgi:hypothetical protein
MALDIEDGIDTAFKKFESTDQQREDAVFVLKGLCVMRGDDCVLRETNEPIESDASKAWLEKNKSHLMPAKYERSLADRAFADGNISARGELVKQVGMLEANKIAQRYGLRDAIDSRRGTAPVDIEAKKKIGSADHKNNPWHQSNFNVTAQGRLIKAIGAEKAAAIAASVGSHVGATHPNPSY